MERGSGLSDPSSGEDGSFGGGDGIIVGDAVDVIETLPESIVHAIVTDPPYSISSTDGEWDQFRRQRNENDAGRDDYGGRLSSKAPASGAEGDNYEYHRWCMVWAEKAKRVLKPGGHVIAFSGNRTHHRLMSALEDVGYEIRDTVTWHYAEGIPKGASLSTWLDGEDADEWGDWRGTLKPATEFCILARAPLGESSAAKNQVKHGAGNLNVEACRIGDFGAGGRYPANVILDPVMAEVMDIQGDPPNTNGGEGPSRFFYCSKASKAERTHGGAIENDHPTVKPIDLMEWLVKIVTDEGQRVLDPFAGSGTTIIAASRCGRRAVGIEQDSDYAEIARRRLSKTESHPTNARMG